MNKLGTTESITDNQMKAQNKDVGRKIPEISYH